jgi:heme O synthase-like polyprenyltransferase
MIFCWVPPPLWALAMEFRGDTAAARVPGPGVTGSAAAAAAAGRILGYSCIMVGAALGFAPYGGWVYTVCAVPLGAWFLAEGRRLRARMGHVSGSAPITVSVSAASPIRLRGLSMACVAQFLAVIMAVVLLPRGR